MAFQQFSEVQYVKVFDTDEEIKCGGFQVANNTELEAIRLGIFVEGTLSGSEQIRCNIYSNAGASKLLFRSAWSDLSDLEYSNGSTVTGDFIGVVRANFSRQNLNKNITYYATMELNNYTRNGDTFYISGVFDYPFPRYSSGSSHYGVNLVMEIFEYRNF